MLEITCCPQCETKLLKHGELLSNFFSVICEYYVITGKCFEVSTERNGINHKFLEIINFLEIKKYLKTTESGLTTLFVKPCGIHCYEDKFFFCNQKHD